MIVLQMWLVLALPGHTSPPPSVHVEGFGFEIGELKNGGKAFMNRDYVWGKVPRELEGWQFTRVNGGVPGRMTATARSDGILYLACAPKVASLEGWRLVPRWRFHYTDASKTIIRVFSRPCTEGKPVPIPRGGWTGCMLLAPKITATQTGPGKPDHSRVPGVVVDYVPAASSNYVGSPAIAVLPGGGYVAAHDFFGPGPRRGQTWVFGSADKGRTWQKLAQLENQHFSNLFVHRGALFLLGVGGNRGQVIIRKSSDGGRTWTHPADGRSGILLPESGYHTAPTPVIRHAGRLWRAMEDTRGPGKGWPFKFRAFVMSAPEDSDLLLAANWTCSNRLPSSPTWLDREFEGWLEGNAVIAPGGHLVNILRAHTYVGGKAAVIRMSEDGKKGAFDPGTGFADLPGGAKKFTIRFDPRTNRYWSLTNPVDEETRGGRSAASVRNTLSLVSSEDLRTWVVHRRLLFHPDPAYHAFQYVDWQFDGDDLVAVSRTAFDDGLLGPHNYHDANYLTFHRVQDFRKEVREGR